KPHNHVAVSVSIDISPGNMNRSGLSTRCTKTDRPRIDSSRIKAIAAENCHVNIFGAIRIDSITITLRPDIDSDRQRMAPKINRANVADADTEISKLIGL